MNHPAQTQDNNSFVDVIRLNFGNSMVAGNLPDNLPLEPLSAKSKVQGQEALEKFGFWDPSSPNFNTYYPNVSPEDLAPKEEDYVYPVYRALSATIVHRYVDFSEPGVLEASARLLVGQTCYANHDSTIGSQLGVVIDTSWQDGYTIGGMKVPPGILSRWKVDGKANPAIARGMVSDPPSLHSCSVTVQYRWKPSHQDMFDEGRFWNHVGEYDAKGVLIRMVVVEILAYQEISVVHHGADPFAQRVNSDGKIVNPEHASVHETRKKLSAEMGRSMEATPSKFFSASYKNISSLSAEHHRVVENDDTRLNTGTKPLPGTPEEKPNPKTPQNFTMSTTPTNESEQVKLAVTLGCQDGQYAMADILRVAERKMAELAEANKVLAELSDFKTEASIELAQLRKRSSELEKPAEIGEQAISNLRKEVKRLYFLSVQGGVSQNSSQTQEGMMAVIDHSSYEGLLALQYQYSQAVDEKFPGKCTECGSHSVTRASAHVQEKDSVRLDAPKTKSVADTFKDMRSPSYRPKSELPIAPHTI